MAFGGRSAGGRLTMCIGAANHRRCRRFVTACSRPRRR
jgi:tRNA(Arg) A34 adenosine deaminase TadA